DRRRGLRARVLEAHDVAIAPRRVASDVSWGGPFRVARGQRERVDDVAGGDGDVLPPADRVAQRRRRHVRARLKMPEMPAALRVERDDVAVADRAEDNVAG